MKKALLTTANHWDLYIKSDAQINVYIMFLRVFLMFLPPPGSNHTVHHWYQFKQFLWLEKQQAWTQNEREFWEEIRSSELGGWHLVWTEVRCKFSEALDKVWLCSPPHVKPYLIHLQIRDDVICLWHRGLEGVQQFNQNDERRRVCLINIWEEIWLPCVILSNYPCHDLLYDMKEQLTEFHLHSAAF